MAEEIWFEEPQGFRFWLIKRSRQSYTYGTGAPDYERYEDFRWVDGQRTGPFKTIREIEVKEERD